MNPEIHRYGDHPSQYVELYRPRHTPHTGVAVFLHGGFWRERYDLSYARQLTADLATRGYPAVNLEYRRVGGGGGWPTTFLDVAAGIDLLGTVPDVDTSAVVTIGHSAGGHLAVWAAGRGALPPGAPGAGPKVPLTGAVSLAGVVALTAAAEEGIGSGAAIDLLGSPSEHPERYAVADPFRGVPLDVPVVAVHARDDDEVPFSQSERYLEAVAAGHTHDARTRLIEVTGGHYGLVDPSTRAWLAVVAAFESLLPPA